MIATPLPCSLAEATRAARASTAAWQAYAAKEGADPELVAALNKLDEAAREVAFLVGAVIKQNQARRGA